MQKFTPNSRKVPSTPAAEFLVTAKWCGHNIIVHQKMGYNIYSFVKQQFSLIYFI